MTGDHILRDRAEALLRELGVRDPSRASVPQDDTTGRANLHRNERAWNQAVELLVAGMRAERAEAT